MHSKIFYIFILIFVGPIIVSNALKTRIFRLNDEFKDAYDSESEEELGEEARNMVYVSLINYLRSIRLHLPLNLFKKFNEAYSKHRQEIKRLRLVNSIIDVYKHEVAKNGIYQNLSDVISLPSIEYLKEGRSINFNSKIELPDNIKKFIFDIIKNNSTTSGLFELAESFGEIARAIKASRAQFINYNNITKWTCHCDPSEDYDDYMYQDELFKFNFD